MSPNEFQAQCLRTERTPAYIDPTFAPPPLNHTVARLLHGAIGICTEAGELQDALKKHLCYGQPLDCTHIMEECFDVLWYVALSLDAAGFTLEEAMARGLAKLRKRYPDGFTEEAARVRDVTEERRALEQG